ncbi:hypothetical protein Tco_1350469 [Tanacetum coccineum]
MSKKDSLRLEEELAFKLQAEEEEEERLAREKAQQIEEVNMAWDDKVDEDKETAELQSLIEIVPDEEEVAIDVIPLATKPPTIGRIVGIKRLLDDLRVTAAQVCVTAAKLNNNEVVNTAQTVNTAYGVFTANTQVNTANSSNVDNLSDAVIYAFLASQPNRCLQSIAMRILALTSPKWSATTATRRDILLGNAELQGIKTTRTRKVLEGIHLWKLPQLWCHVMVLVEVSNNSNCSKSCLINIETLKSQYDQLHKDFKKYELMVLAYKTGLELVEEKLEVYKANESIYSQDIKVLKFEIECKDIAIRELRKKLEITQKEKDSIQFNIDKFENASKSLDKLIECQIVDNCKKGLGYNAVLRPYTRNFMPSTPDLSFTGLDEFVNKPVVENRKSDEEVSKVVRKSDDSPIIEHWVSDIEEEDASQTKTEKKNS